MEKIGYYKSPIGWLSYTYERNTLSHLKIVEHLEDESVKNDNNPFIDEQLKDYFNGRLKSFDLDFVFGKSTPFQQDVWNALLAIPYGQTRNYQEIANSIGRPKAYRAVGQACKKNPISIVIPCHRVIGKDNSLTGYSGKGYTYLKEKLLTLENAKPFKSEQI